MHNKSYWPAIIVSLVAHIALVYLVVWGWSVTQAKTVVRPPTFIKASLVELKPKVAPASNKLNRDKEALEKKRQAEKERRKQRAKEQAEAKKRQERKERLRKEQLKKEQLKKEQLKKERLKKEQQKKEQRRKEQFKKEQLKKEQLERDKRQQEKLRQQRQREEELRKKELRKKREKEKQQAALAKELEQEQARLENQRREAEDAVTVQSYIDLIATRVEQHWSRPSSARNGMEVLLSIQLVPTGQVVNVSISSGSGDAAFDRSAVNAVNKVKRFTEIKQMPARVFETYFRSFTFSFSPEDLRQ